MRTKVHWLILAMVLAGAAHIDAATLTLFAGGGTNATGTATNSRLADPFAVDFDAKSFAYISEMTNNRVVSVHRSGALVPFAGMMKKGSEGDGGPALAAEFNGPHHLIVAQNGDVFIADTWNCKIRVIDAQTKRINTFAGTGKRGYSGDGGRATKADFSGIYSLAFDAAQENLYLADLENRRVRVVSLVTGDVRLVAGNGEKGIPADGSDAISSPLFDPRAVAVAKDGNIYILERSGNALRVVDSKGKIRTVIGTGKAGPWTPTENPLEATLKGPKHLCVDKDGNVLIADTDNHVIRKYLPKKNKLLRIAGTGKPGRGLSEDPLKTELNQPHGVNVDAQGRIYICDSLNSRVLRIEP
jgi:DNA-binding beta-propeller fold protein YncE